MSTNFYSFISHLFGFTGVYSKLYNSKEFQEFQENISSGSSNEYVAKCLRGFILPITDNVFSLLDLGMRENEDIFNNKDITKEMQCKLFICSVIKSIYDPYSQLNQMIQTSGLNIPIMDIVNIGFSLLPTNIPKEELMTYFIETLNTINKFDKINNAKDIYTILMEYYINQMTELIINALKGVDKPLDEDFLKTFIENMMSRLNTIYSYTSLNYNYALINKDNTSDSSNITTTPTVVNDNKKRLNPEDKDSSKKPRN